MKRFLLRPGLRSLGLMLIWVFLAVNLATGQDLDRARRVIRHLCAERLHGRGYVLNGNHRAAAYLGRQFQSAGVQPFGEDYFQRFYLNVNTFPGSMSLRVNGILLRPGVDYLVDPASPGTTGDYTPIMVDAAMVFSGQADSILSTAAGRLILLNEDGISSLPSDQSLKWKQWIDRMKYVNPFHLNALVEITGDKLIFGTSTQVALLPHIRIVKNAMPAPARQISLNIANRYEPGYPTANLVGYLPGSKCPDSLVVFTAHYDHLGVMGRKIYFPGANDNASGVAMLLELVHYFQASRPRFSVAFICFSGEEAGLVGSTYFVENPCFSLQKVKFLINLDLVGTGEEGITVVNGSEFPGQFDRLIQLNAAGHFVTAVKRRGEACNSDHCPFYESGVPCFFLYTLGGIKAYHDIYDRPETLPLYAFAGLTRLIIRFTEGL